MSGIVTMGGRRFNTACECLDPSAGLYEHCEAGCGASVAVRGGHFVEDDCERGCPVDDNGVSLGHSLTWTTHTASRCRNLRRLR